MSVLVTGGAGYIGSHMAWALLDAGESVIVLDNFSTGFRWAVPRKARLYEGDVGDNALLHRIFLENNVDAVVHFAGSIIVPESVRDPLGYYENNTLKSHCLISAAVEARIPRFIFSSTAAVYGTPESDEPVSESAKLKPESPYGSSKLMTEIMLRDAAAAHDLNYTTLRYFNVAGADPFGRTGQSTKGATHLIKVACETVCGLKDSVSVYGTDYPTADGTCIRDYIHVWDLVQAHIAALNRMRGGGGSIVANCGYGQGFSVFDVLNAVQRVSERVLDVRHAGRRQGDAVAVVANPQLAIRELGWKPEYDELELIISSALEWETHLSGKALD